MRNQKQQGRGVLDGGRCARLSYSGNRSEEHIEMRRKQFRSTKKLTLEERKAALKKRLQTERLQTKQK